MRNVATVGLALGIGWLATACKVDMNVGDWLTPDLELGGTDTGSGSGSGGSGSGDKGDPDPQTMPACIEEEQGGETSCKDVATWKDYAWQACEAQGLQLSSYIPREECGKDAFRYVDYSCCPEVTPPSSCIKEEQGGDTSCKDVATWKQYADQACASHGLLLSSYAPREECGKDAFRYVDYSCCPQVTPPSSCTKEVQGGDTSCKDVATWKQNASQACEAQGLLLSSYFPREECGKDAFRYVDYSCCPSL
jgi:hypothetical protein